MFSSQVLFRALEPFSLEGHPVTAPSMRRVLEDPTGERAFLLNLNGHWFAIRRMGEWRRGNGNGIEDEEKRGMWGALYRYRTRKCYFFSPHFFRPSF
jgi:hypothetical protein